MTESDLIKYSLIPLKQQPNRVWRTYHGGEQIDKWQNFSPVDDSQMPEEWIMSAVAARGANRPAEEGLSRVITPDGNILLTDLIASSPGKFLGDSLAKKYGTTGILIKILDTVERLTVQVHPDKECAREMFNSAFGKTESWYILGHGGTADPPACIYLGFKEGITREKWQELFRKQDIKGMLDSLHRFEVKTGDAFIIYGGVPHAIGAGCFLTELQEPTDLTLRVEKTTPRGLAISDELIHQGIGEEKMLGCFNYTGYSRDEAIQRWKIKPEIIESQQGYTLKTVFNEKHTRCFSLNVLDLKQQITLQGKGDFFVAVIYSGEGIISCNGIDYPYTRGESFFFPAAIEKVTLIAKKQSEILLCYPPG